MTALLMTGARCEQSTSDSVVAPYVPPPCANVYQTAVDAKRGPLLDCCVANYHTFEHRQECIDMLGQGP